MRILIAGATGVIGRQAVRVLTAAGHDVVALARTPTRLPDVDVVAADALDATALTRAVRTATDRFTGRTASTTMALHQVGKRVTRNAAMSHRGEPDAQWPRARFGDS